MSGPIVYILGNGGHTKDIKSIIYRQPVGSWWGDAIIRTLDDKDVDIVDVYLQEMSFYGNRMSYLIGVNSSQDRREIDERMRKIHARIAPALIDPTAIYTRPSGIFDELSSGCVLGPYSVLSADAKIGIHTHLNIGASINQGSWVGNYCTLSPGVRVCGDCTIGDAVQFGANSTVINLKTVGHNVIIGAGAVVVDNIPDDITVVGIPAKPIYKTQKYSIGCTI